MKFWMCFNCKRILEVEDHEIIPNMQEGWRYGLSSYGIIVVLCPVCSMVLRDRKIVRE